jgi:hypothetical protein
MSFPEINSVIGLLGCRAKDKVTDASGVVTSVAFDLYGCVQAALHAGLDKDGKPLEQYWYDVQRLVVTHDTRVMEPPRFGGTPAAEHASGQSAKPPPRAV